MSTLDTDSEKRKHQNSTADIPDRWKLPETDAELRMRRTIAISNIAKETILFLAAALVIFGVLIIIKDLRHRVWEKERLAEEELAAKAAHNAEILKQEEEHRQSLAQAERERLAEAQRLQAQAREQERQRIADERKKEQHINKLHADFQKIERDVNSAKVDFWHNIPSDMKPVNAPIGAEYSILSPDPANPENRVYYRMTTLANRKTQIERVSYDEDPQPVSSAEFASLRKTTPFLIVRNGKGFAHLPSDQNEFTLSCPRKGDGANPSEEQFGPLYKILNSTSSTKAPTIFYEVCFVNSKEGVTIPIGEVAFGDALPEYALCEVLTESLMEKERNILQSRKADRIRKKRSMTLNGPGLVPTRRLGNNANDLPNPAPVVHTVKYSTLPGGTTYRTRSGTSVYRYLSWQQMIDHARKAAQAIEDSAESDYLQELRKARAKVNARVRTLMSSGKLHVRCLD